MNFGTSSGYNLEVLAAFMRSGAEITEEIRTWSWRTYSLIVKNIRIS